MKIEADWSDWCREWTDDDLVCPSTVRIWWGLFIGWLVAGAGIVVSLVSV